jgi:hypothetical protein
MDHTSGTYLSVCGPFPALRTTGAKPSGNVEEQEGNRHELEIFSTEIRAAFRSLL